MTWGCGGWRSGTQAITFTSWRPWPARTAPSPARGTTLPGAGSLPRRRTTVRAAPHGSGGSHRRAARHPRCAAFWFTVPERDTIYQHASRQAARAAEHIRHCAYGDPAAAADAAWAAADTLHAAARALRSPVLRCAADAYDRAARAGYGRIPGRSHDGDRLRATARLLAMAGDVADDVTSLAAALVSNLATLAAAVVELRQAQRHAAQAAAARSAAQHLHAAMTQARSQAPRPCRGEAPRRGEAARATGRARAISRYHCWLGFARPPTRLRQPRSHLPARARCRPSVLGRDHKRR